MRIKFIILCLLLLAWSSNGLNGAPLSTAFIYHGELKADGQPANGFFDFLFQVFDAAGSGSTIGGAVVTNRVAIANGLFTVTLDFGRDVFTGPARWLQISVSTNLAGSYTELGPRQPLLPTPYAQFAAAAATVTTGAVNTAQLALGAVGSSQIQAGAIIASHVASGQLVKSLNGLEDNVTLTPGPNVTINTVGNSLEISAPNTGGWGLTGNAGTVGANFLGTIDDQPLELKVNGTRALRLEPNTSGAPNVIGGSSRNFISGGIVGGTIAGGGAVSFFVTSESFTNRVTANFATVGGGAENTSSGDNSTTGGGYRNSSLGVGATISGGTGNIVQTNGAYSTISGGLENLAGNNAAFVGGGTYNHANGSSSTLAGGYDNTVSGDVGFIGGGARNRANNSFSTIAGGENNTASGDYSSVGGGEFNQASGQHASIAGGSLNTASGDKSMVAGGNANATSGYGAYVGGGAGNNASGTFATVTGGFLNLASGDSSFAAGRGARALHDSSFVWSDRQGVGGTAPFESTAPNQFSVRASGGIRFEGDVKLGSSGQFFALGGEENLRIIRGTAELTGNVLAGSGFTLTRISLGYYRITFSTAFADVPTVLVSGPGQPFAERQSQTSVFIVTTSSDGSLADQDFSFIIIGPR